MWRKLKKAPSYDRTKHGSVVPPDFPGFWDPDTQQPVTGACRNGLHTLQPFCSEATFSPSAQGLAPAALSLKGPEAGILLFFAAFFCYNCFSIAGKAGFVKADILSILPRNAQNLPAGDLFRAKGACKIWRALVYWEIRCCRSQR